MQNLEDNLKRQGVRIRDIPLVMQYNKRDLPNALPTDEIDREVNKLGAPKYESVATTGLGVEETLKGITNLVLAHLIKKYGLEGSEPNEREIQILNPTVPAEPRQHDSLWDDEDEQPLPAASPLPPANSGVFMTVDAGADESIPLVPTELIAPSPKPAAAKAAAKPAPPPPPPAPDPGPFGEISDYFATSGPLADVPPLPGNPHPFGELPSELPMTSVEIPLPDGILSSLPDLGSSMSTVAAPPHAERRSTDGLVKEVTVPLNLTAEELRQHRRLRLKITLDVNLLP